MSNLSELFFVDNKGIHVPDFETLYQWYIDQYKAIYGADIVLTPDTQDGQWIGILAQAYMDTINSAVHIYNSFNPGTALGDALDKNIRINGIFRKPSSYSTCDVKIIGQFGTRILNGSVRDTLDRIWYLPQEVIIPIEGEIIVTAQAEESGEWRAQPNTLTTINTPTRGWQSVNNENSAAVGAAVESDAALRRRQTVSVSLPSQSILEGMLGECAAVPGVIRYRAYENDTSVTDENGIPPHSNCLVIEGGDARLIGEAIYNHKTVGSGTYGDTVVFIDDKYGNRTNIKFQRPTIKRLQFKVKITPFVGFAETYIDDIKSRLTQYINNLGIGCDVYVTKLYPPILACNTANTQTFDVTSIELALEGEGFSSSNFKVGFDGAAYTEADMIEVIQEGVENGLYPVYYR